MAPTATQSLTIATERDIIVNGNILRGTNGSGQPVDGMLGLIADNFVRVWHPVINRGTSDPNDNPPGSNDDADECDNDTATLPTGNREIDAAMLSLNRSFTVDNYYCGSAIGTLTVKGTIAQKYRGAVGHRQHLHGLRQELHLRRPPVLPLAAALPGPGPVGLAPHALHRAGRRPVAPLRVPRLARCPSPR